jgi:cation diffusion facilitator CzcD-associated flavoprotein CzcO
VKPTIDTSSGGNGAAPGREERPDHDLIVIGSGFSGLAMTHRLKAAGRDDFIILERGDSVGGTWRDNHYPGCACDIQSHLYSFSFALNPDWSRMFAEQPEIRAYLERCATQIGARPHLRFGAEVTAAAFDEEAGLWRVTVNGAEVISCRILVSGIGGLSNPSYASVPGLERFRGPSFHSAEWDHDVDLERKRVAVIGTGASAIQFVPQIAPEVSRLSLFQRTAPWIIPKRDRRISRLERALYRRFPAVQRAYRRFIYWALESRVVAFTLHPWILRAAQRLARAHIRRQISDPELRDKVTPNYLMGCKRILISSDYYPALNRDNVEVVTERIERVTERGIVTTEGRELDVDVLIHGTGFHVQDMISAVDIRGRGGVRMEDLWAERGMQAHRGTAVAGFPNLFFLLGPNTGLGHNSIVFMIEAQIQYLMGALRTLRRNALRTIEVRPEAQAAYNAEIDRMTEGTVWVTGGCKSWYIDANGHNSTLWPTFTWPFRQRLREFDEAAYALGAAAPLPVAAAA